MERLVVLPDFSLRQTFKIQTKETHSLLAVYILRVKGGKGFTDRASVVLFTESLEEY